MMTLRTTHLGDGAYAGMDAHGRAQVWLGANHHENMTVALGVDDLIALLLWLNRTQPTMFSQVVIGALGRPTRGGSDATE